MKNITLNIIGQRVLADVLFEKKNIINMEILFFLNFEDYFSKIKNSNTNSIIITEFSNFSLIENSKQKINFPIFYLANSRKKDALKTQFQNFEIILYPINLKVFFDKISLKFIKSQFKTNSNVNILNYVINLNTREIKKENNKLKLTEREKDLLLFLKNSDSPKSIKNILESVWGYSEGIETHTVETHVHRLRKKFLNSFNDNNFIKNDKKGYFI